MRSRAGIASLAVVLFCSGFVAVAGRASATSAQGVWSQGQGATPNCDAQNRCWTVGVDSQNNVHVTLDNGSAGPTGFGTDAVSQRDGSACASTSAGTNYNHGPGDYGKIYGGVYTWTMVVDASECPGFGQHVNDSVLVSNGLDSPSIWPKYTWTDPPPVVVHGGVSVCTAGDVYADGAAGLVGQTVSVRFKSLIPVPSGGWDLWVPGVATPDYDAAPTAGMGTGDAVDGSPSYYSRSFDVGAGVDATTVRVVAHGAPASSCYLLLSVHGGAVVPGGGDVGATDPDAGSGGATCGLNPFCYIKAALRWAFVPGQDTATLWQATITDVQSRPPVSLVSGGVPIVGTFLGMASDNYNTDGCNVTRVDGVCGPKLAPIYDNGSPGDGAVFDPLTRAGQLVQTNDKASMLYKVLTVLIWGSFLLIVWRRVSQSFGEHE